MAGAVDEPAQAGMSEDYPKFAREMAVIEKAVTKVEGTCAEIQAVFKSGDALNDEGRVVRHGPQLGLSNIF